MLSIRLKFFRFLLFTKGTVRGGSKLDRAPRLKKRFNYFGVSRNRMNRARRAKKIVRKNPSPARPPKRAYSAGWHLANLGRIAAGDGKRRSESGAAVRPTRVGELGSALGCDCFSGGKTGYGFPAALGRAWGCGLGGTLGSASAALRAARAGHLPSGVSQHVAPRRELSFLPGARPANVKLNRVEAAFIFRVDPAFCPPRARGPFIPRGNATENRSRDCSCDMDPGSANGNSSPSPWFRQP